jgi:hypothetical protein
MIVARNVIIERDHVERVGARKQQRDPTPSMFLTETGLCRFGPFRFFESQLDALLRSLTFKRRCFIFSREWSRLAQPFFTCYIIQMESVIWDLHRRPRDTNPFFVTNGTIRAGILRTVAEQFLPPNVGILDSTRAIEGILNDPVVSLHANRRRRHKKS